MIINKENLNLRFLKARKPKPMKHNVLNVMDLIGFTTVCAIKKKKKIGKLLMLDSKSDHYDTKDLENDNTNYH